MAKNNTAYVIAVNPQQGETNQYLMAYTYQSVNGKTANEIIQTISSPKLAQRYQTASAAADFICQIISRKDFNICKDEYQVVPVQFE